MMQIMPHGAIVYSDAVWLIDIYSNGGPDFSAIAQFDVENGWGNTIRLNPKYIISCWVIDEDS